MAWIRIPRRWEIPEREITPRAAFTRRREFLRLAGLAGTGLLLGSASLTCDGKGRQETASSAADSPGTMPSNDRYPAKRNHSFRPDRPVTPETIASRYNNFYEFGEAKEEVWRQVGRFEISPWRIEIRGLVENPATYDLESLLREMPLEERIYRFRCVEAWAMVVPWTGFPFRHLIDKVRPLPGAQFVRLVSFHKPEQAPGQARATWYPWPYHEALTIEEAMNDLTMLVTGIYGHPLPKQHGAPLRLIVPWKYGYKSIKSIARIEFVRKKPPTFWNTVAPREYGFVSNVDPAVPHPRWSQATERMIGSGKTRPTLPFNGYAEQVAGLYRS
ncbi:MAG: protein-methionine-sulfoxide reductase catalytic subunit MsrP [Acidobacteria bacterium]|nr:protein-methionine-sulfoxide reductase catalytic subunit MsrP [Acidobacteriota bacterium]